jgi:hypothetical protein
VFERVKDVVLNTSFTGSSFTGVKAVLLEKFTAYEKHVHEGPQTDELKGVIENQSKPVLRQRRKEIESTAGAGTVFDFLRIELENCGDGVAENLYVRPSLTVRHGPDSDAIDIEDACFIRDDGDQIEIVPRYARLTRTDGDFIENDSVQGGVLSTNEGRVTFSSQIEFQDVTHRPDGAIDWTRVSVSEAMERLYSAGIRRVSFTVHVLFTDANENLYAEQIMGKTGDLTGGLTLEDIQDFKYSVESPSNERVLSKVEDSMKYPP